jgi:hypothetical protein
VDEVVELHPGWHMDIGAPQPILLQTEHAAALVFTARDLRRRLVVFEGCSISRFGYPNDEALPGHPLYTRGLESYACYEVMNSFWRSQLASQNRVNFPDATPWFAERRHFVITFHDSMFECLADDMRWEWVTGSTVEALRTIMR